MRNVALLLALSLSGAALAQEKEVALRTVKYDGLKDVVFKNRGKVIYIDFWYNT